MENQESFSLLLLRRRQEEEGVKDVKEAAFDQGQMRLGTQNDQILKEEKTSKTGSDPISAQAGLNIIKLQTKTEKLDKEKPIVETNQKVRTSDENPQKPEVLPRSFVTEVKLSTPKPEDFFEANSKLEPVSDNAAVSAVSAAVSDNAAAAEILRSKSCKHGSSRTMVCPECGVNVHKCQVCKSVFV